MATATPRPYSALHTTGPGDDVEEQPFSELLHIGPALAYHLSVAYLHKETRFYPYISCAPKAHAALRQYFKAAGYTDTPSNFIYLPSATKRFGVSSEVVLPAPSDLDIFPKKKNRKGELELIYRVNIKLRGFVTIRVNEFIFALVKLGYTPHYPGCGLDLNQSTFE